MLLLITTNKNLVLGAPACTWRCAGEGELLFALIHCGPILRDLAEGINRQFLLFCPIAKTVGGRQQPSGQAMREKQRDSGANRAGGGQCRAEARLQTGLENNGSQSVRGDRWGKPLCREEAQKAQKKGINYVWLKAA